ASQNGLTCRHGAQRGTVSPSTWRSGELAGFFRGSSWDLGSCTARASSPSGLRSVANSLRGESPRSGPWHHLAAGAPANVLRGGAGLCCLERRRQSVLRCALCGQVVPPGGTRSGHVTHGTHRQQAAQREVHRPQTVARWKSPSANGVTARFSWATRATLVGTQTAATRPAAGYSRSMFAPSK